MQQIGNFFASVSTLVLIMVYGGCSHSKPVVIERQLEITTIYQSDEPEIKDLGNGWIETVGTAVIQNITPEEAKRQAILKAYQKAIEYYSGVEISARTLAIQAESQNKILLDHFSSLSSHTTKGIILDKRIIREEIKSDGSTLIKMVVLQVKVGKQSGEKDPYFTIEASLNRYYFRDGEEVELTVRSSKDCYLTVLNISSNDSVYVIFPNQYRQDNLLTAGETFELPNDHDKRLGVYFPVSLLPNKEEDVEMLKIIATKEKVDFASVYSFSAYGTYQSALEDLQRWLIRIPRNEMEEIDLQYFIAK